MSKTLTRKLLSASAVGVFALGTVACSSDNTSPSDDPIDEVDPIVDEDIVDEDIVDDGTVDE